MMQKQSKDVNDKIKELKDLIQDQMTIVQVKSEAAKIFDSKINELGFVKNSDFALKIEDLKEELQMIDKRVKQVKDSTMMKSNEMIEKSAIDDIQTQLDQLKSLLSK